MNLYYLYFHGVKLTCLLLYKRYMLFVSGLSEAVGLVVYRTAVEVVQFSKAAF